MAEEMQDLIEKALLVVEKNAYISATILQDKMKISFELATQLFDKLKEENLIDEKAWRVGKKIDQVMINALEKTVDYKKSVVSVRVTDKVNEVLEDLVTFSIAQSKSEAAFMLMIEGIKAKSDMLAKLNQKKKDMENMKRSIFTETEGLPDFGHM